MLYKLLESERVCSGICTTSIPQKQKVNKVERPQGLVDGLEYEGIIQMIGTFKKIKCDAYPYPIRIEGIDNQDVYEDERVIFTAKSRPNIRDENKTFWFAINVRLKEE